MVDNWKRQYFAHDGAGYLIPHTLPAEKAGEWKNELALCDCATCIDRECNCKNLTSRFPADAGGQDQCLRLMQTKSPFSFRNGDGTVITIPPEVVTALHGV